MSRIADNKGFTLIEVLISVMLLSVGLLAVAAMQTTAIGGNTSANNTTISTQLAEEMVDRIRVNGWDKPEYYNCLNTLYSTTATYTATDCTQSGVSGKPSMEPALTDYNQWKTRLDGSGLPSARGAVTVQAGPVDRSAIVTVTITWGLTGTGRSTTVTTIIEMWLT